LVGLAVGLMIGTTAKSDAAPNTGAPTVVRQAELIKSRARTGGNASIWTIRQTDLLRVNMVEMRGTLARHRHPDAEHSLLVFAGRVAVEVGDRREEIVLGRGDYISIPRGVAHQYRVVGESALLISMDAPYYDPAKTELVPR
jgi:mannose-6-phosphate isomerase-like protein (cupin superfamily)